MGSNTSGGGRHAHIVDNSTSREDNVEDTSAPCSWLKKMDMGSNTSAGGGGCTPAPLSCHGSASTAAPQTAHTCNKPVRKRADHSDTGKHRKNGASTSSRSGQ